MQLFDASAAAKSLTDLLRVTWNWAWWLEHDPGLCLPLVRVTGSERRKPSPEVAFQKTTSWEAEGHSLALQLSQDRSSGETLHGELTLSDQGETVLRLKVHQGSRDLCSHWCPGDMIQWRPGDWIGVVERCAAELGACELDLNDRYFRFVFCLPSVEEPAPEGEIGN